jgi:hypothetical protein
MSLTINKIPKKYKPKYDRLESLSNRYDELDKLANLYNKTKDNQYKEEWYERIDKIIKYLTV